MPADLTRRLARLEASATPSLRQRHVFCRKGEPDPEPEPGERLTIYRWIEDDDDAPCAAHPHRGISE